MIRQNLDQFVLVFWLQQALRVDDGSLSGERRVVGSEDIERTFARQSPDEATGS